MNLCGPQNKDDIAMMDRDKYRPKADKRLLGLFLMVMGLFIVGCSSTPTPPPETRAQTSGQKKPVLYVVLMRDRRLPQAFTGVTLDTLRRHLPSAEIISDEGRTNDGNLARADWILSLRATRIIPNYSFKPSSSNAVNGVLDCTLGGAMGTFLTLAPCRFSGDEDQVEASIHNRQGTIEHTFKVSAEEAGYTATPPLLYITNLSEEERWQEMAESLLVKIRDHQGFSGEIRPEGLED
jgi:hypothetical protein